MHTDQNSFFFAGGGTGGHLYPAMAVAQCIQKLKPASEIHFFCSNREIDTYILSQTGFQTTILPARAFPSKPGQIIDFVKSFNQSCKLTKNAITKSSNSVVIGLGGFVSGPVCWTAHRNKIPLAFLNVDILPGKANKLIARWADEIFVQFADTAKCFEKFKAKISVTGCPLRSGFDNPSAGSAIEQLGLDRTKKTLLITGASSGSESINNAVCSLSEKFNTFAGSWQIVHLSGRNNYEKICRMYEGVRFGHKVLGYYDDMPNLLAAADLVIGRSGAVSVAEFIASAVPCILIPYPHHKDRHQYLNAEQLVRAGSAVVVDDLPDKKDFSEWLWEELEELMKDDARREQMKTASRSISKPDADIQIAHALMKMCESSFVKREA
jgi:UDP-N-acetylglucosamine--N-acetylmuramyl-(pentapeptide) pyrophosphoryl-undecaprenol N-acetylglucosamine transferase